MLFKGLLNERIINVFRTSEITHLDLSASLSEEGGLNMGGKDVWDGESFFYSIARSSHANVFSLW